MAKLNGKKLASATKTVTKSATQLKTKNSKVSASKTAKPVGMKPGKVKPLSKKIAPVGKADKVAKVQKIEKTEALIAAKNSKLKSKVSVIPTAKVAVATERLTKKSKVSVEVATPVPAPQILAPQAIKKMGLAKEASSAGELTQPQKLVEKPVKKAAKSGKGKADKGLVNIVGMSATELQKKWSEYHDKFGSEKAPVYSMGNSYEAAAPLQHKVLGWGFVVSVQNDRLEVLFESGSKTLISNYRPR